MEESDIKMYKITKALSCLRKGFVIYSVLKILGFIK